MTKDLAPAIFPLIQRRRRPSHQHDFAEPQTRTSEASTQSGSPTQAETRSQSTTQTQTPQHQGNKQLDETGETDRREK